jgi:hypothetical protein
MRGIDGLRCGGVFLRRAFPEHGHANGAVIIVVILVRVDADMVARLEIADVRVATRVSDVLGGTGDVNRGDHVVVRFDHDVIVVDLTKHSRQRRVAHVVLIVGIVSPAPHRNALAAIAAARETYARNDDLAKPRNTGQEQ